MVQPEKADVSRGWKNLSEMGESCWKPEVLLLHTWWLFSLFAATFQKRNKYIYLTRPQYQDPSLSHWEMGWNKRVILWSARQIFLSLPTRPPALYFEERWSLRQPPSDGMGQPVSDQGLPMAVMTHTCCWHQSALFEHMWAVLADQHSISHIEQIQGANTRSD